MKKSFYKRMEKNTCAWDLTAACRKFTFHNKSRRKLRKELRRKSRKAINRFMEKEMI